MATEKWQPHYGDFILQYGDSLMATPKRRLQNGDSETVTAKWRQRNSDCEMAAAK